jgi:mRNA interferase MazF
VGVVVDRFDLFLVALDPTIGSEIKKTRPCVIISPNEMNKFSNTIIIAPLTSKTRTYPTRINITFQNKKGQVVLDQIRSIDKRRLLKKIGKVSEHMEDKICNVLVEMFSK